MTTFSLIQAPGKTTYDEFLAQEAADPEHIYELLNGYIVKKTSPSPRHQFASMQISKRLSVFVEDEHQLGFVFTAPLDVFFDEQNAIKPDVIYVSLRQQEIITDDGITGAPDLLVEIISPHSARRDRVSKKALFERYGVPEYWLADPVNATLEVYVLPESESEYQLYDMGSVAEESVVHSRLLDGFTLPLQEVFMPVGGK